MRLPYRRWRLLLVRALALFMFAFLVAACDSPGLAGPGSNGSNLDIRPNQLENLTPTPTFEPETIGAYMSNQTPNDGDFVFVIAMVRIHVYATPLPPQLPTNPVQVTISGPVSPQTKPLNTDGNVAFQIKATGQPGIPQIVQVTANDSGHTISTTTFYAVLPPLGSPTPSGTITPTTTPGP